MTNAATIAGCSRPALHAAIRAGRVRARRTVYHGRATWRFNAEHLEEDLAKLRCRHPGGCELFGVGPTGRCSQHHPTHGPAGQRGAHSGLCPLCRQAVITAPLQAAPAIVHLLEPGEVIPHGPCVRCAGSGRDHDGVCARCRGAGVGGVEISADETLFALSTTGSTRAILLHDRRIGDALHRAHECPGGP